MKRIVVIIKITVGSLCSIIIFTEWSSLSHNTDYLAIVDSLSKFSHDRWARKNMMIHVYNLFAEILFGKDSFEGLHFILWFFFILYKSYLRTRVQWKLVCSYFKRNWKKQSVEPKMVRFQSASNDENRRNKQNKSLFCEKTKAGQKFNVAKAKYKLSSSASTNQSYFAWIPSLSLQIWSSPPPSLSLLPSPVLR